jgi:phosphate transport system substrate-binding protein
VKKNIIASVALAASGLLLLSACGGSNQAQSYSTVLLDGSSTVGPFAEAAAELFMDENSDVRVTVGISGTGGGFEKFCNGETDGSNASRDIKDEESSLCAQNGVSYGRVTVANDALSVIVNKENPLECISVEALNALWGLGSTVSTWGEIPGISVGALGSEPVVLYGPGTDSGTFDFFTDEINGESGNIRTDYNNIGEDDNQAVQGVSGNLGAMAFIPYSFYQEYSDSVKGLAIDNGNGCVDPTIDKLLSGEYAPLGRSLYMFPSQASLQRPEVVAFFTFVIEQNEIIAEAAGLVPLTPQQKTEQLAIVAELGK